MLFNRIFVLSCKTGSEMTKKVWELHVCLLTLEIFKVSTLAVPIKGTRIRKATCSLQWQPPSQKILLGNSPVFLVAEKSKLFPHVSLVWTASLILRGPEKSHDYSVMVVTVSQCFCNTCPLQGSIFNVDQEAFVLFLGRLYSLSLIETGGFGDPYVSRFTIKLFLEPFPIWYAAVYLIVQSFMWIWFLWSLPVTLR